MPNLDGGHLFLTVLAPILDGDGVDPASGAPRSHRHLLRQELAKLPTGRQTARSPADAAPSPFAANRRNHLARLVVIDGPAFNGRVSRDTLLGQIAGSDPLTPQPVDTLPSAYLLFAADVDAQGLDEVAALDRYSEELWATMAGELRAIFGHCAGFERVESGQGLADYLRRCQVETTMPFNDYWPDDDLTRVPDAITLRTIGIGVAVLILASGLAAWWLAASRHWSGWLVAALVVAVVAAGLYLLYRHILRLGAKPLPAAPGSDLPTVLKALFLQQAFTRFAIDEQGMADADLHAAFGRFLAATAPAAPSPTQQPGAVASPAVRW